jgi:hypothetical protein
MEGGPTAGDRPPVWETKCLSGGTRGGAFGGVREAGGGARLDVAAGECGEGAESDVTRGVVAAALEEGRELAHNLVVAILVPLAVLAHRGVVHLHAHAQARRSYAAQRHRLLGARVTPDKGTQTGRVQPEWH